MSEKSWRTFILMFNLLIVLIGAWVGLYTKSTNTNISGLSQDVKHIQEFNLVVTERLVHLESNQKEIARIISTIENNQLLIKNNSERLVLMERETAVVAGNRFTSEDGLEAWQAINRLQYQTSEMATTWKDTISEVKIQLRDNSLAIIEMGKAIQALKVEMSHITNGDRRLKGALPK